jgi:diamine N-acetyltransferase
MVKRGAAYNPRMSPPISWPPGLSGNHLRATFPNFVQLYEYDMKPVSKQSVVSLRAVTKDTVRRVSLLDVGPGQEGLVAPNAFSMAQANFHPEAWFRAIYADDEPVGFAMLEDWTQVAGSPAQLWRDAPHVGLWRFMIDHRYQGYGCGAAAIRLLIEHARTRPGVANMLLSFVPKENNPEKFYQRFGFARTGEMDGDEVVMSLKLR